MNVLQTTFTPSKQSSTHSHPSGSSQRKARLNLKHSPIQEESQDQHSSVQRHVPLVQVGQLNLDNNGLPDPRTQQEELRKDEDLTKKTWCAPVSTRETAPLDESEIVDLSPDRSITKLQIDTIGSIKKPRMTSDLNRSEIAYRNAADPSLMKMSLTNYGGENYMSPPISPRNTFHQSAMYKSKTATKVRGAGAKEQAERLRLGYSGALMKSGVDERDHILGFVSPEMRDTIHSPRVDQKLDFDNEQQVKTITNYYSTKDQDHIHIQGLQEQIRQLELENLRLVDVLHQREAYLASLG